MKISKMLYWCVRLIAVGIMLQTLYFKFTGAEESVYIFTRVGMEPWGRIGVGILEMIASILILVDVAAWLGAALAFGLMVGAILMHLTLLGIVVKEDGGQLFIYAATVLVCSVFILVRNKEQLMRMYRKIFARRINLKEGS